MVAVVCIVLFLLAVVWFLWFRRTPLYRAHRRIGVVPGQSGVGGVPGQSGVGNTATWYGDRHVPPLLPELRPDVDEADGRPSAASGSVAERRRHGTVKYYLIQRSRRRSAAEQLAAARRGTVAQHSKMRRELRRFFSPSEYPHGRVAGRLACVYFAVTLVVIVSAIPESNGDTLTAGLALLATLPVSLGVLTFQDDGTWMLAGLAVCALINAFVFWVVFRGDPG